MKIFNDDELQMSKVEKFFWALLFAVVMSVFAIGVLTIIEKIAPAPKHETTVLH